MTRALVAVILMFFGVVLALGGVWLIYLGGSWYYLPAGAGLVISALLLFQRIPAALSVYATVLVGTIVWAWLEVGFDWWALAPRGAILIGLGLILLVPPIVRTLDNTASGVGRYGPSSMVLMATIAASGVVAIYSMFLSPHDIAGQLPNERMVARPQAENSAPVPDGEWHHYGRTRAGLRYSPLDQITPKNVDDLEVAWTYQTGEVRGDDDPVETTYEVTPLVVGDMMYVCTPFATVIALDPVSGEERWRFDPQLKQPPTETTQHMTCRSVTYFDALSVPLSALQQTSNDSATPEQSAATVTNETAGVTQNVVTGNGEPSEPNPQVARDATGGAGIMSADCRQRLFVPTSDGRLIAISAQTGASCPGFGGEDGTVDLWANMPNVTPGSFYSTSPPLIAGRLIVVGGAVNDNVSTTSPSGVIRAYDAFTGELVWNFDAKNPEQTEPIAEGNTYSQNAPNSWSVASYDPDLNLVYLPMGNESPDQFGGNRGEQSERFSASVLALDAASGEVRWVFQTVHHDLWDMDVPAQPSLFDLQRDGESVPALLVPTKQGDIFVLDRRTGEPLFPVREEPAPQGAVEGDFTAPTQPVSAISFEPPPLEEEDMWGATPLDQMACRISFLRHDYRGRYTPPSVNGTIVYPGNFGTFNWGAVAVDPHRQIMFGMPVYLAFRVQLVERPDDTARVVTKQGEGVFNENFGAPYAAKMGPFLSMFGLPCQQPPWGYVAAVDLVSGDTVYKRVNGTVRDLSPVPLPFEMGVPGIGGPIVTAGGVAFLSGTLDYYVRGYNLQTGEELWRERLPAGGQATPSTYLGGDGKQYLVVVAGGHGSTGTKAGDSIIAYRLP